MTKKPATADIISTTINEVGTKLIEHIEELVMSVLNNQDLYVYEKKAKIVQIFTDIKKIYKEEK